MGHPRDGLDTEMVREAADMLRRPPVGDKRGSVVIGPMDRVSVVGIEDVLLKVVEEFDGEVVRPYLWAGDLGGVRATIRSRCLDAWSPGVLPPSAWVDAGEEVVRCSATGNLPGLIDALGEPDKWKESGEDVLRIIPTVLRESLSPARMGVWLRVRKLLCYGGGGDDVPLHEALSGLMA